MADPAPALGFNQVFVDPVNGVILGTRQFGACCLERENLIPFIWELHYSLYLPRPWGAWLMGVIALVWLADCFVAFYLTLPARLGWRGSGGSHRRGFWTRWKPAWAVKIGRSVYRFTFDLHRAGGLWFWGLLLLLAVSSVVLNLTDEIARPLVSVLSPVTPAVFETRKAPADKTRAPMSFDRAFGIANAEAARRDWTAPPRSIYHFAWLGLFSIRFHRLGGPGLGQHWLYLDDVSGEIFDARAIGESSVGDAFMDIQLPLHGGSIAGLPGRILIALAGLVVAMLSVTGVVIWWKKRSARTRAEKIRYARTSLENASQ